MLIAYRNYLISFRPKADRPATRFLVPSYIGHNVEGERATNVIRARLADGNSPPSALKTRVDDIVRKTIDKQQE